MRFYTMAMLAVLERAIAAIVVAMMIMELLSQSAFAESFASYRFPSSITLSPNTAREDITIATKGNGEQTFYHAQGFHISGASNATYTLKANDSTTHFENGGMRLDSQAKVALLGYHTLSFYSSSLVVDSGGYLKVILSDKATINPQASEYGGESKVRFGERSMLHLGTNTHAEFTQLKLFIHDGYATIDSNAKLIIEADRAIRFQHSLHNNGGTLTLKGNVYNIGSSRGLIPNDYNTTAHFTSTNGTIVVNGDFYNGGQAKDAIDASGNINGFNSFDPAFGGGGDVVLWGGTMSVSGKLISQRGGDAIAGGDLRNPQDSSIRIYGGVLKAQSVENKEGSTITFGAYQGQLGRIEGNLHNNGGTLEIDTKGLSQGTYTFLQGTLSGTNTAITIRNQGEFFDTKLDSNTLHITQKHDAINAFHQNLHSSESAFINALDALFTNTNKGSIYSYVNGAELGVIASDMTDSTQFDNIITPLASFEALHLSSTTLTPITPSVLARLGITRFSPRYAALNTAPYPKNRAPYPTQGSASYQLAYLATPSYGRDFARFSFDARAIGGGVFGKYGAGGFGGAEIGANFSASNHNLRVGFSFLTNTLAQTLHTTRTKSTNHAFGLSLSDTIAFGGFELDIGLLGSLGLFHSTHSASIANHALESSASFLAQRLMGELAMGYRFYLRPVFFKPYVSMRHYLFAQNPITQSGAVSANLQGYVDYMVNLSVGAQSGFAFMVGDGVGIATLKADYEPHLYNTQKAAILAIENLAVPLTLPYGDKLSLGAQAQYQLRRYSVAMELFYTHSMYGLHTLGANASLALRF